MKPVSVQKQRKLMYIPLVNVVNFFLCIYNLNVVRIRRKQEMKIYAYLLGYFVMPGIVCSAVYRAVSGVFPVLEPLLYAADIYLVPMVMSYGLIKFQQKYVFTDNAIKT